MMRSLETMRHYLQYEIHHSKYYLKRYFETCHIVSNITTNCPKAHCKYLQKTQKIFTNKSPWQNVHTTQPKGTSPCEQAQAKNTAGGKRLRVGKHPLFIPNQKGTHTKELSL